MKTKIYINGIGSVSSQDLEDLFLDKVLPHNSSVIPAISPDYKKYIPVMQLRRMSKGIKMGLTAAKIALAEADLEIPDAVITATGHGSKLDTEKFLQEMLDRNEETLSPTSFIQSTHNTIGGQIALNLGCKGYNMTYSQNSASLASAFIDSMLFVEENPGSAVLVGGVDEISEKITSFQVLDGQVKTEEIDSRFLLKSQTPGTIISEGAHFFTLSANSNNKTYAEFVDVAVFNSGGSENLSEKLINFLKKNHRTTADIDLIIFGKNGDCRFDYHYNNIQNELFSEKLQLVFKHLTGDYDTVTGFAVALACSIFRKNYIPPVLKINNISISEPHEILIYNQYLGEDHCFILLRSFEL